MENNYHYFIETPTKRKIFPISLKYTQIDGFMVVEAIGYNQSSIVNYTGPIDPNNPVTPPAWIAEIPDASTKNVQLFFDNGSSTELYAKMGSAVVAQKLPGINNGGLGIIPEVFNTKTSFYPRRKIVYYKPSNHGFATQGAVSSSDLIARRKYNTINTVAGSMRSAYGEHTASAVAYGVPSYGYTKKDKIGYPMKKTPTFSKYSDIMKKCSVRTFANAI